MRKEFEDILPQIIKERNILQKLLDRKDWCDLEIPYHKQVRIDCKNKIDGYNLLIDFMNKS